ncbi:MAG: bifunctional 5,10-methylenetetrahydrofolate dehydrogenase/5,10-methenyltetrahydrofolate cyclohydrolase [Candidatus Syntropharchaeia archaeon]
MTLVVDGRKIASEIKEKISLEVKNLVSKYGTTPTMGTIIIGDNKESELYFKLREKASSEVGIKSEHYRFSGDVEEGEIIEVIEELNSSEEIHGIIIQQPIPEHISLCRLLLRLSPDKDVEGMTPRNLGKLMIGEEDIIPCTPLAVLRILEHVNVQLKGANVAIVNHSPIVGKPLAILLLNRNATVSVCHVFTRNLKEHTRKADILITATGVPGLIGREYVKEESVVIDVGISKTKKGICGDVAFDEVKEVVSIITPVPGGVGPVTIASALENLLKLYKRKVGEEK